MKKNSFYKFWKVSFFSFLLLTSSHLVFALESPIPGLTKNSSLPQYVVYFFTWAVGLAATLGFISLAIAGIMLIAAGSGKGRNEAKEQIKGAIIGILLCASAYLILNTINTQLTKNIQLTPLAASDGIFCNGKTPAPLQDGDTGYSGCKNLTYICKNNKNLPKYFAYIYSKPEFKINNDFSGVYVSELACDGTLAAGASYSLSPESPGIYYCNGSCGHSSCSGYMTGPNVSSGIIQAPFRSKLKSILVMNDPSSNLFFGAIFHGVDDNTATGMCSSPILSSGEQACQQNIPVSSSVDILNWNPNSPDNSPNNVQFYSEPFGWDQGARAGKCFVDQSNHKTNTTTTCQNLSFIKKELDIKTQSLNFDYQSIDRTEAYKNMFSNFQLHSGSIKINGGYLIGLYSSSPSTNGSICQTFTQDIPNLKSTQYVGSGGVINDVIIVPTN